MKKGTTVNRALINRKCELLVCGLGKFLRLNAETAGLKKKPSRHNGVSVAVEDMSTEKTPKCIEEQRTYRRDEIIGMYPWLDNNFWPILVDFFGLLPMGPDKNQIVAGRNLIEALSNHASGNIVECRRRPITRERLRDLKKRMKLEE